MKAVILAGGFGTRISEETKFRPKPMIEIGEKPILWHIMKIFAAHKIDEFIVCCGYKGEMIQKYFDENNSESWNIKTVDTGLNTMTGGRIKRIEKLIGNETFCLSYGDDLKNVDVSELINFHKKQKKIVTMTITKPTPRYGIVKMNGDMVESIKEKSKDYENCINGCYFSLEPDIFEYIKGDKSQLENEVLSNLSIAKQVCGFKYFGEYYPLDTPYDKKRLDEIWNKNEAYWKVWD